VTGKVRLPTDLLPVLVAVGMLDGATTTGDMAVVRVRIPNIESLRRITEAAGGIVCKERQRRLRRTAQTLLPDFVLGIVIVDCPSFVR